jgi:hypothetical protein
VERETVTSRLELLLNRFQLFSVLAVAFAVIVLMFAQAGVSQIR